MGLKVRLHWQAKIDLDAIHKYPLDIANPSAAERVRTHLRGKMLKLCRQSLGVKTTEPDIRILSPTKYPYRIQFTVSATEVVVLHIRHTSRHLPNLGNLR